MNKTKEVEKQMKHELMYQLEAAHAALVEARKLVALSKHKSYVYIGEAIECVESAVMTLPAPAENNSKNFFTRSTE